MGLKGKGFFLWKIARVEGGDPVAIANAAQQSGLTHVLVKVADGKFGYNFLNGVDLVGPLVNELRARNIRVWGWQYIYGVNPEAEADKAIARVQQFNLDGFVVNAEKEFAAGTINKKAEIYIKRLRNGLGKKKIALSTYRYPSVFPAFPFRTFLEYCNIAMPQIYWVEASNPAFQLRKSVTQYQLLTPSRPIIPTGAAYPQGSWRPTPGQITEFLQEAVNLGLSAANFWEWYPAQENSARLWNAMSEFAWPGPAPTSVTVELPEETPAAAPAPSVDMATRYLKALNSGLPNKVTQLYEKNASKLVFGSETYKGRMKIYSWHNRLLTRILPDGKFQLTGLTRSGNTYELKWSAKAKGAKVVNGVDRIQMSTDHPRQISVHETTFKVRKN
ncbi:MAG: hypothetical protein O3B43_00450 [Chloroflexi bacterium]|nr:hypothetical protein [Chloroflexota bacterium]